MPRIPDATAFSARRQLQGRGGVPNVSGSVSGVMQAADIQAQSTRETGRAAEGIGHGLMQASEVMFAGAMRERERLDAVDRARAIEQLSEQGNELLRNIGVTSDWSDPVTLKTYREQVNSLTRTIVEGHAGSANSRARLAERAEQVRSALIEAGNAAAFDAGQAVITRRHAKDLNNLVARTYADPTSLTDSLVALDAQLKDIAPALERDQEDAFRQEGRRELAVAALTSMIDRRQVDEAEKIMLENETVRSNLGLADLNRLFDRIATIRMEKAQGYTLTPGSVRFDAAGNPVASVPTAPREISPGDVTGPILAKMAAGQTLTAGEQAVLDYASRLDPINKLIAASMGAKMGATDEFSPPTEQGTATPANQPAKPQANAPQPVVQGEGLTVDQQADLQNAMNAIARGADENAVRKRIEESGDQVLLHAFDKANVIRKGQ